MGRDLRTPKERAADCRAWYLRNREYVKMKSRVYRRQLKADPVRWAEYLAKARAYKRKKFGWTRIKRRPGSSVAEQPFHKRQVAGSIPAPATIL